MLPSLHRSAPTPLLVPLITLVATLVTTLVAAPATARDAVCDTTRVLCAVLTAEGDPARVTVGEDVTLDLRVLGDTDAVARVERRVDAGSWTTLASTAVTHAASSAALRDVPTSPGRHEYRVRFTLAGLTLFTTPTLLSYAAVAAAATYPSSLEARGPTSVRVRVGRTGPVVTGRLTDASPVAGSVSDRLVVLRDAAVPGGAPVATTRTDAAGRWSLRVPTDFIYSARLVVEVASSTVFVADRGPYDAAVAHLGGARTTATIPVSVEPAYRPHGSGSHSYLFERLRAWHDPCTVITYRVNTATGPRHALAMTRHAVSLVAQATGYRFRYEGRTTAVPFSGPDAAHRGDPRSVMTIAWTDAQHVRGLRGDVIGLGGAARSGRVLQDPLVALDGEQPGLSAGFGRGATYGSLLLHEIGHAMGLGHVDDPTLVMHSGLGSASYGRYGRGDLAGLAQVDALNPCAPGRDRSARATPPTYAVMR